PGLYSVSLHDALPICRITLWNGAAERLYGYAEAEVLGSVGEMIPPEEEEEFHRVLESLRLGRSVTVAETRRRTRSGEAVELSLADRKSTRLNSSHVQI